MPVSPLKSAAIDDTRDVTMLTAELRSCLSLADKLNLPMVGIHIEQACAWLAANGHDRMAGAGDQGDPRPAPIG
ncbi:MAG: hypothetical protein ACK4TC_09870 [Sphingomonas pseudosanguinis]